MELIRTGLRLGASCSIHICIPAHAFIGINPSELAPLFRPYKGEAVNGDRFIRLCLHRFAKKGRFIGGGSSTRGTNN